MVVLATDTGVGKTFVGCALTQALRSSGFHVRVRKPVETGCSIMNDTLVPADASLLWSAAGQVDTLDNVCPLRFRLPVAAPQAAASEGVSLQFEKDIAPLLKDAGNNRHAALREFWIIEGAGGALSPLTEDALNCDLATFTGLPIILIAPDRLGTLSTLFAHIEALARRAIPIAAIVLNQRPAHLDADNIGCLKRWLPELMSQQGAAPKHRPVLLSFAQDESMQSAGKRLMDVLLNT